MRLFNIRRVSGWPAALVFMLTLLVSACDLNLTPPPGWGQTPPGHGIPPPPEGGSTPAGICDATVLNTVLDPVPPSAGTTPIDVRVRYHRPDGNYADWGLHLWQVNEAGQYITDYPGVT